MIGANCIIDLSHHSGNVDLVKAKADGIVAIIQKATQGTGFTDPTFATNRQKAADAGLLFGTYHFGTGADGVDQADFFLNVVQPNPGDLLVLDFEANAQGPSMTMEEARAFVTCVQASNLLWPGLYSGHYLKELLQTSNDPVLTNCWLWISQYGSTAVIPPAWKAWPCGSTRTVRPGRYHIPSTESAPAIGTLSMARLRHCKPSGTRCQWRRRPLKRYRCWVDTASAGFGW